MHSSKRSSQRWSGLFGSGLLLCLLLWSLFAPPSFAADAKAPAWVTVGHGSYTRFFVHVYDATLETQVSDFRFPDSAPYALTLTYKLDLDADLLIDNTLAEWNKQKLAWPKPWLDSLKQYLPDVMEGDSLRLEVNEDHSAVFLYNGKELVTFTDLEFVNAFVGIWLADNSTNPVLRKQLLGTHK